MKEKPKRLAPTRETLRELYLKTGNHCAFPGCERPLINSKGVFVGQLCHIEAAEPGGPRFNPTQTNEDRRQATNLLFMCYEHHTETDDVSKYSVESMKKIKKEHEKKYSDVVGSIVASIVDQTKLDEPVHAKKLQKLNEVLEWNLSKDELNNMIPELDRMISRLSKLPKKARELFEIIVSRSTKGGGYGADREVNVAEIQQATGLRDEELREIFSILVKYQFTCDNDVDEFGVQLVGVETLQSRWPVWSDIRKFCKRQKIPLAYLIVNLDFSVLD